MIEPGRTADHLLWLVRPCSPCVVLDCLLGRRSLVLRDAFPAKNCALLAVLQHAHKLRLMHLRTQSDIFEEIACWLTTIFQQDFGALRLLHIINGDHSLRLSHKIRCVHYIRCHSLASPRPCWPTLTDVCNRVLNSSEMLACSLERAQLFAKKPDSMTPGRSNMTHEPWQASFANRCNVPARAAPRPP